MLKPLLRIGVSIFVLIVVRVVTGSNVLSLLAVMATWGYLFYLTELKN